mmetsp:Transcript_54851/g.174297  ORF Transcript_54851/g.174297 Transcript_54851/m.174297 type:complete len:300 (-) Transcript_54851:354-1253(-)
MRSAMTMDPRLPRVTRSLSSVYTQSSQPSAFRSILNSCLPFSSAPPKGFSIPRAALRSQAATRSRFRTRPTASFPNAAFHTARSSLPRPSLGLRVWVWARVQQGRALAQAGRCGCVAWYIDLLILVPLSQQKLHVAWLTGEACAYGVVLIGFRLPPVKVTLTRPPGVSPPSSRGTHSPPLMISPCSPLAGPSRTVKQFATSYESFPPGRSPMVYLMLSMAHTVSLGENMPNDMRPRVYFLLPSSSFPRHSGKSGLEMVLNVPLTFASERMIPSSHRTSRSASTSVTEGSLGSPPLSSRA